MDRQLPSIPPDPSSRDCTPSDTRHVSIEETRTIQTTECDGEVIVDEVIDLEVYIREQRRVPLARVYRIRIDKGYFVVEHPVLSARALLALARKTPAEKYVLRQIVHGQPVKLELNDTVDFRTPGIEKFKTMLKTAQDGGR
jgi:hypothetical protein